MTKKKETPSIEKIMEHLSQDSEIEVTLTVKLSGIYAAVYKILKDVVIEPDIDKCILEEGLSSFAKMLWLFVVGKSSLLNNPAESNEPSSKN